MDQLNWLNEREEQAWRGLQLMEMRLERELARQLAADSDLSYPDYLVLVVLSEQLDGRMRVFEIGEVLSWEKSRLSHHLSRMEKRDLITKEPCDEDRRGAFVVISKEGRTAIEAAAPGHLAAVRRLFVDHLDSDQLDALVDITETVLASFGDGPSARTA